MAAAMVAPSRILGIQLFLDSSYRFQAEGGSADEGAFGETTAFFQ
jgi:hypothetical protein